MNQFTKQLRETLATATKEEKETLHLMAYGKELQLFRRGMISQSEMMAHCDQIQALLRIK